MIAPTVTVNMLIYIGFTLCRQQHTRYSTLSEAEGLRYDCHDWDQRIWAYRTLHFSTYHRGCAQRRPSRTYQRNRPD